jgi:hypothetical protein
MGEIKTVLIENSVDYHYEIIESVIVKHKELLKIGNAETKIYLSVYDNKSFKEYITIKYPNVILEKPKTYDYYVNCTVYNRTQGLKSDPNYKYIAHEVTNELLKNENVYYLTPLSKKNYFVADILPFTKMNKISNIPIYIIQGNITNKRRNYNLLEKILKETFEYEFKIKFIGRGSLPASLKKYKEKIILKQNLNFQDYHKEFLDGYCILPLITKQSHPMYYKNKLTSTINYAKAYNMKCLIDNDLQEIYKLKNVQTFSNEGDIVRAFKETLLEYYK